MSRRVLISGVGVVSPLGVTVRDFGERLFAMQSGVRPLTRFDPARFRCRRAAEVDDAAFRQVFQPPTHEISRMGRFVWLALAAARDALQEARLLQDGALPEEGGGIYVGVAMGGLPEIEAGVLRQEERGPGKTLPYLIPSLIPNMAASQLALHYRHAGPQLTINGACASGSQALGMAFEAIQRGERAWALAGGVESVVTPITFSGFQAMRVLSAAPDPAPTPRPFDREADGMIVGEGAAFFVLEDEAHAARREHGARGELLGYASTSQGDRLHLQSPAAAARCMRMTLDRAGIRPGEVDAVFAQSMGLKAGDLQELLALHEVFGGERPGPVITSIKGHLGHTFGASGPLGLAAALEALGRGQVPGTLHFRETPPEAPPADIAAQTRARKVERCLINSFGFGSINACLVVSGAGATAGSRPG